MCTERVTRADDRCSESTSCGSNTLLLFLNLFEYRLSVFFETNSAKIKLEPREHRADPPSVLRRLLLSHSNHSTPGSFAVRDCDLGRT